MIRVLLMSQKPVLSNMVQYSVWPNCCNNCQFCLRLDRDTWSKSKMLSRINDIRINIDTVDWKNKFSNGISLLGGEIYFINDIDIQNEFMLLIDDIINKILKVSPNPDVKYSTVTNGLYSPEFLFKVLDKIVEECGTKVLDINFSYDLKYRYSSEERRQLCIDNINKVHNRYNYIVGVQTITTQYFIDEVLSGRFDIKYFEDNIIPGNELHLLYPHPINPKLPPLPDFQFKRKSLIDFSLYLKKNLDKQWHNFYWSTYNSGIFKYTGIWDINKDNLQEPVLSDGKELINSKCGHSKLYQCYSDSDKCMLCDLLNIGIL